MLNSSQWPYIRTVALSGNLEADSARFLSVNGKQKTAAHCKTVAETSAEIAARFGLDKSIASASALLHDISSVMRPADMLSYATTQNWEIDESEKRYPFLLHQRLSAVFARDFFNVSDSVILSAIECHTTLKPYPSEYDMALFLTDKLSWDQEGVPPFYEQLSSALESSLSSASLIYIDYVIDNGMILFPHRWLAEARGWLKNR